MATSEILGYCDITFYDNASATAAYSAVEGNWARAFQLWDNGEDRYVFWGDTTGELTLFDLQINPVGDCDLLKAVADYTASTNITLYQGHDPTRHKVLALQGLYSFGLDNARIKPIGDIFVIEGGTNYKIFL